MSRKVGRPAVFRGNVQNHVTGLIRRNGLTGAQQILAAGNRTKLARARNKVLFPEPVNVSLVTLARYARLGGVQLTPGRRAA